MNIDNFSKCNDAESVKHKQVACRDKSKFKCACGKVYDYEGNLRRHIRYKPISYTCPHCSKVISGRNFKNHLDSKVCRKGIRDDDNELILGNNRSSSSNSSSHKSHSRPLLMPSNGRG